MSKQSITGEMGIHKEWYLDADKQTLESLPTFISNILDNYSHDYGTICHALAAGGVATMYAMDKHEQGGITGFQAGAIMWSFIRNWNYSHNKTGLRLINYDNMLYPQYEYNFAKEISQSVWKSLQAEAKNNLDDVGLMANPGVIEHWKSIVDGVVPFGYTVKED